MVDKKYAKISEIIQSRMYAGLTQKEAAKVINYSERSWQEWESGRNRMKRLLLDEFLRSTNPV